MANKEHPRNRIDRKMSLHDTSRQNEEGSNYDSEKFTWSRRRHENARCCPGCNEKGEAQLSLSWTFLPGRITPMGLLVHQDPLKSNAMAGGKTPNLTSISRET